MADVFAVVPRMPDLTPNKAHATPVGPAVFRELYGAMTLQRRTKARVVALSGFTSGARQLARETGIELWDVEDLVRPPRTRPS